MSEFFTSYFFSEDNAKSVEARHVLIAIFTLSDTLKFAIKSVPHNPRVILCLAVCMFSGDKHYPGITRGM